MKDAVVRKAAFSLIRPAGGRPETGHPRLARSASQNRRYRQSLKALSELPLAFLRGSRKRMACERLDAGVARTTRSPWCPSRRGTPLDRQLSNIDSSRGKRMCTYRPFLGDPLRHDLRESPRP